MMMRFIVCLCIFLFFAAPVFSQINYPDYSELSNAELLEKAKSSDAHAYYTLGHGLLINDEDGSYYLENLEQAIEYVSKADKLGHADAPSLLAVHYFGEFGAKERPKKARKALLRGIERNSDTSKMNFAFRYVDSENKNDAIRAFGYLEQYKNHEAMRNIALPKLMDILSFGNAHIVRNLEEGRTYAQLCADTVKPQNSHCQFLYARYLQNGWGGAKDEVASTQYFKTAAQLDDARAQWWYGMALIKGIGVDVDETEAFRWVKKSAEQEYLEGLISYAVMNVTAQGTLLNYNVAFTSYEKAARLGSAHALRGLGAMMMEGQGTELDEELGFAALLVADQLGEPNARIILNFMSDNQQFSEKEISELRKNNATNMDRVRAIYGFDQTIK